MQKSNPFYQLGAALFTFFVVACATTNSSKIQSQAKYEEYYQSSFCSQESLIRMPSSAPMCEQLFAKSLQNEDSNYSQRLQNDPLAKVEALMSTSTGADRYPVRTSTEMRRFRDRFLGFIKNTVFREPLTRSFEAAIRMKSKLTENAIKKNNNYSQYDIVIVGTGVHGIIALHQALSQNPSLKVLLIDEGDTAGATFRYGKEVFNINSSNRRSGEDTKPLPGGNLNELPGLPIQVSDLTAVKYPTANDLGTALVAGLYAAVREYPNVEVLFNTKATGLLEKPKDASMIESIKVMSDNSPNLAFQIDAQRIILTTGLGEPNLPPKVAETVKNNPNLTQSVDGKVPKVVTFEDMVRILASSNDPAALIKDKKIAVVGKGDSANVFIEYLLGFAPREGYARSSAQDGRAEKIFWIGQDKQTCADFISDIRSRYQQISTGFRASAANLEAIIKAYPTKLADIRESGKNKIEAQTEIQINVKDIDFMVVTTGFNQNVRGLFNNLNVKSNTYAKDPDFFDGQFETLTGTTYSSVGKTKIGRKLQDREVYVLGTAAGELADKTELAGGIVQNFVSIFNNAPRVVASVKQLTTGLKPIAKLNPLQPVEVSVVNYSKYYTITDIQESRFMPNQTMSYLESTFKEALSYATNPMTQPISLTMSLQKNGTLKITSDNKAEVKDLINLLAQSREFFSLAKELLKFTPDQGLLLTASAQKSGFDISGAKVQTTSAINEKIVAAEVRVSNKEIKLRGLRSKVEPVAKEKEVDKKEKDKKVSTLDLKDPSTYTKQIIFHEVQGARFAMGEDNIATEITKPFSVMATPMTQLQYAKLKRAMGETKPSSLSPSKFRDAGIINVDGVALQIRSDNPVEQISYRDVTTFIEGLNQLSKSTDAQKQAVLVELIPGFKKGAQFDLLTEAQYELMQKYAVTEKNEELSNAIARLGNQEVTKYANILNGQTEPVTSKRPLFIDGKPFWIQGNVFEFVKDIYQADLPGGKDPLVAAGNSLDYNRVVRGLSYLQKDISVNIKKRFSSNIDTSFPDLGFRLVMTMP